MSARNRLSHRAVKYRNGNNGTSVRFLPKWSPSSKAKMSRGCSRTQTRVRAARRDACVFGTRALFDTHSHARIRTLTHSRRHRRNANCSQRVTTTSTDTHRWFPPFLARGSGKAKRSKCKLRVLAKVSSFRLQSFVLRPLKAMTLKTSSLIFTDCSSEK